MSSTKYSLFLMIGIFGTIANIQDRKSKFPPLDLKPLMLIIQTIMPRNAGQERILMFVVETDQINSYAENLA